MKETRAPVWVFTMGIIWILFAIFFAWKIILSGKPAHDDSLTVHCDIYNKDSTHWIVTYKDIPIRQYPGGDIIGFDSPGDIFLTDPSSFVTYDGYIWAPWDDKWVALHTLDCIHFHAIPTNKQSITMYYEPV